MTTWSDIGPRLISFAELEEGWDSYNAKAPAQGAIHFAIAWLATLHEAHPEIPPPHVSPTPDGGIGVEWDLLGQPVGVVIEIGEVHGEAMIILPRTYLAAAGPLLASMWTPDGS